MGYVAVKGGTKAIEESIELIKYERLKNNRILNVSDIEAGMRSLIDQVMSEASLYSTNLAAISIKQAEGSPEEAVFLMRAYRSTLPRRHYSLPVDTSCMFIERRISSSFKDIPGGQILGASVDYTHRLIDFMLVNEKLDDINAWIEGFIQRFDEIEEKEPNKLPKVIDYLREEGLLPKVKENNDEPYDITKKSLTFPGTRSQRLQTLTRGQTGALISLGYAALRGYGAAFHPTVGELRYGSIPIHVKNPLNSQDNNDDEYYIGEIKVTEVETLIPVTKTTVEGKKELEFSIGYGLCYGQNESKAIAMSLLDYCLDNPNEEHAVNDEEFILYHIDSIESTGFISHLKLPHYVTFQSKLDSIRKTGKEATKNGKKL